MKKLLGRTVYAQALALLLTLAVSAAWAQESPVVNVIEIKGLKRIEQGSVLDRISHRTGERLSTDTVTSDIQAIYSMGYFDDVRVEVEPFEGGVRLQFIVREKPVITRVGFDGNKKLKNDKLQEQVTLKSGSIADTVSIQGDADRLRALYAAKGFALAEVVPVVRRTSRDQALLTFQIKEGPKVKIKKVAIEGNKALSAWAIKGAIRTTRWWPWDFITGRGYYEKHKVEADVIRIRDAYFDKGYIQATVSEPILEMSDNKKGMRVTFKVFEGEQFRISGVTVSGNKVFGSGELVEKVKTRAGKVFSKSKVQDDVEELSLTYSEKGYAAVVVTPDVSSDVADRTVKVNFRISEGGVYSVGRISISGNHRTRDKVIRREVRLHEGDTFDGRKLKRSYQRIKNTKFFEDISVLPRLKHKARLVDLDISVREKKTGSISVGVGYSSVSKLVGMVEFTQANLAGRGQSLNIKAEVGGESNLYTITFTDPWFMDKPIKFSTSLYNVKQEFADYNRKATGFTVGFGREFMEYWQAFVNYKLEQASITDVKSTASSTIKEQDGTKLTSSITPSVVRDTRDDFMDTRSGSRSSLSVALAGLGGENRFVKAKLESEWYFPVGENAVVALKGRFGYATGIGGKRLPLYERFYVGGIQSVRGLDFGEAGPRDENDEVIGGLKQLVLNAEFQYPISKRLKVKWIVFFDAGTAYDDNIDDLRYTTGTGMRWLSPMGPLRLEWGYNLDRRPGEPQSKWEFSIGTSF